MLFQHRYLTFRLPIGVIFLNEFKGANGVRREIMNKIDYSILFCRKKPHKGIAGTSRPRLVSEVNPVNVTYNLPMTTSSPVYSTFWKWEIVEILIVKRFIIFFAGTSTHSIVTDSLT